MPFKFACHEFRFSTDEMQNLDNVAIAGHCTACGEYNRQNGCGNHKRQNGCPDKYRRMCHGNEPVHPGAMIIECRSRNSACDFSPHGFKIRWSIFIDRHHNEARYGQFINIKTTSQPRFEQPRGRSLIDDAGTFDTGKTTRNLACLSQRLFHVLSVDRPDLDRGFARDLALPGGSRGTNKRHAAHRQTCQKGHDRDHNDQRRAGNAAIGNDGARPLTFPALADTDEQHVLEVFKPGPDIIQLTLPGVSCINHRCRAAHVRGSCAVHQPDP